MLQKQLGESERSPRGPCAWEWQPRLRCSAWLWLDDRVLQNNTGVPVTSGRWKGDCLLSWKCMYCSLSDTCVSSVKRCVRSPGPRPGSLPPLSVWGATEYVQSLAHWRRAYWQGRGEGFCTSLGWGGHEKDGHVQCSPVRGSHVLLP